MVSGDPLARLAAVLAEANQQSTCICGKSRGHAGWLLCALEKAKA